jgi:hypothetical protein
MTDIDYAKLWHDLVERLGEEPAEGEKHDGSMGEARPQLALHGGESQTRLG